MTSNKKVRLLSLFFVISLSFISRNAYAEIAYHLQVSGNQRLSTGNIIRKAHISLGHQFTDEDADEVVKLLMATGEFESVTVKNRNGTVFIQVKEYPRLNQISFRGNKKLKNEDLLKVIGLQPREAFDQARADNSAELIKQAYNYVGLNNVTVTAEVTDIGEGRSNVLFNIVEGKKAKIAHIYFLGVKHFSPSRLQQLLITKETNILSWLTQSDIYSEDRLAADEEILRRFYQSHGFADFRILSRTANLDQKSNSYTIIFTVDEGIRYKFGSIEVESSIEGLDGQALRKRLATKSGAEYDVQKVDRSVEILNDLAANQGFAFAQVNVHTDRDFDNHTLSLVYNVDKGARAYIERIEIRGNEKTRDYVIRRAFDVSEGDAFNQTLLQQAKRRLDNSGFFQSVNLSTLPGSAPDKIILVVDVVEDNTGTLSASAGYVAGGDSPGFSIEGSMREANLLGRGQSIRLGASIGARESRSFNFSFTDPYFLGYRIASGIDLFQTSYRMNDEYNVSQVGGTGRLGFSITEDLGMNLAYNYVVENYGLSGTDYPPAIIAAGSRPRSRSSVQYGVVYNTLDNLIIPHEGSFIRVSQELAGLGGEAHFLRSTASAYYYSLLSEPLDIVGVASFGAGVVMSTKSNSLQVFDMFKNSNDMIRGFRYNGIGPRQSNKNGVQYFLGGKKMMSAALETNFPFPIVPASLGLRGAFFVNAGTIYDTFYKPQSPQEVIQGNAQQWRVSAGTSLLWSSPLGPLRFDYAIPLKKYPGDVIENFVFGVSVQF